ncbi:histone H3-like centromeric protein cid [Musca vetustissima]|uniref:histone H3-like centromeric protein cid n=1 Tax=Musca vetustissima TaxID=27455 RepID=UPI002AB5E0B3|nr:histone H3-like centromeric protein cid [Musca vetustissima]
MPRAGPRSKVKESVIVQRRGGSLGESSTTEDDTHADQTTSDGNATQTPRRSPRGRQNASIPVKPSEGFRTPESDVNATDYGLEFTTSHIQNPSPRRCSTLRTGSSQEESATRPKAEVENKENAGDGGGGGDADDATPKTTLTSKAKPKSTKAKGKPLAENRNVQNASSSNASISQRDEASRRDQDESRDHQDETESRREEASLQKKPTKKSVARKPAAKGKKEKPPPTKQNAPQSPTSAAQEKQAQASPPAPPVPVKKKRKQKNPIQRDMMFLRDVQKLQNRTDYLIPRLPFARLIREIMLDSSRYVERITPPALEALQAASEMYVTQRLQDAYMLTLHRGRVTLDVRDMELINFLKMHI